MTEGISLGKRDYVKVAHYLVSDNEVYYESDLAADIFEVTESFIADFDGYTGLKDGVFIPLMLLEGAMSQQDCKTGDLMFFVDKSDLDDFNYRMAKRLEAYVLRRFPHSDFSLDVE